MKINEVIGRDDLKKYKARVQIGGTSVSIGIRAGSLFDAKLVLSNWYENKNVLSVVEVRDINEQQLKAVNDIRDVSTQPVAYEKKREVLQRLLQKKMLRHSNIVRPGIDDLAIAGAQVAKELKRADYEHEKEVEKAQRKQERQKRRRSRNA